MARKLIQIDWEAVDDMLSKFCDGNEIAATLGISYATLERAVKREYNVDFVDYKQYLRGKGAKLIREKQFDMAIDGDRQLLMWIGKQYLGQSEKTQTQIEIPETSTFSITFRNESE